MADVEYNYRYDVKMTCGGCSGAVERALKKNGVETYAISLEKQEVLVKSDKEFDDITSIIKKTGKEVRSAEVIPPPAV